MSEEKTLADATILLCVIIYLKATHTFQNVIRRQLMDMFR